MKIHRYVMKSPDCVIETPRQFKLLSVGISQGVMSIWAEVDPNADKIPRHFRAVNTGGDVPPGACRYIGTTVTDNRIVWHVYEIPGEDE